MNHLEAKETIARALPGLTPEQRLVVQGVSLLETGYGNWGPDPLKGAGSNNMGAITDPSYKGGAASPGQFLHQDSRPATAKELAAGSPAVITYVTAFRKYGSPELGFQDVARTALKPNVNAAIASRDLYGVSSAMHANVYYTGVLPTAKQNIDVHYKALSNAVNNILLATGESNPFLPTGGDALPTRPLLSQSRPSEPPQLSSTLLLVLRVGSVGSYVKAAQVALKVTADGIFGRKTETAVRIFQSAHNLIPDGVIGPKTWRELVQNA